MLDPVQLLRSIDKPGITALDRARAVLWLVGLEDRTAGLTSREICNFIEASGHPAQNISRLNTSLSRDRKFVSRVPGQDAWRLNPAGRRTLDGLYNGLVSAPPVIVPGDNVLPNDLFTGTRGYIEKVVSQINASYDTGLYDCCAVMCRRLLETLIIEVYEHAGRADDIKDGDGNFLMFSGLLGIIEKDAAFTLSRNAKQGLKDFKRLGDLSAHNRRFNARRTDIDNVKVGLRVPAEELLHLSGLI